MQAGRAGPLIQMQKVERRLVAPGVVQSVVWEVVPVAPAAARAEKLPAEEEAGALT